MLVVVDVRRGRSGPGIVTTWQNKSEVSKCFLECSLALMPRFLGCNTNKGTLTPPSLALTWIEKQRLMKRAIALS